MRVLYNPEYGLYLGCIIQEIMTLESQKESQKGHSNINEAAYTRPWISGISVFQADSFLSITRKKFQPVDFVTSILCLLLIML